MLTGLTPADWADWVLSGAGIYHLSRYTGQSTEIRYSGLEEKAWRTVWSMAKKPAEGGGMTLSPDG